MDDTISLHAIALGASVSENRISGGTTAIVENMAGGISLSGVEGGTAVKVSALETAVINATVMAAAIAAGFGQTGFPKRFANKPVPDRISFQPGLLSSRKGAEFSPAGTEIFR